MQLLNTTAAVAAAVPTKQSNANHLNINTISNCMQATNSNSSTGATSLKYANPPLPPRFLQQQQQLSTAASSAQSVSIGSTLTSNNSLRNQLTPQTLQRALPPQVQPQQVPTSTITSGNSLNSFIAARNLAIQTNATANVFNLHNHYQQAQQQAFNSCPSTNSGCNTATAALIAQLAAATSNKQLIPQSNQQVTQQPTQPASMQQTQCTLNNTLFVGNLHASLQEIDLIQVFRPFGRIVECCKKWLHFGFVKFSTEEEACHAYVTLNGFRLKGRPMRLEFQNRTKKVKPFPLALHGRLQFTFLIV